MSLSHMGKVRSNNEDYILSDDELGLWVVADGMGGHACGEVASELACQTIQAAVSADRALDTAVIDAHEAILKQAGQQPHQKGMGATVVAAQQIGPGFNIAWVGDSRAYYFDQQLHQLTQDHTFVQDMVYRGALTPEEARSHHQRHLVNRSLGMESGLFRVEQLNYKPMMSGFLFLCSDGVNDYVSHHVLDNVFKEAEDIEQVTALLSESVLKSRAGDNFSFVVVEVKPGVFRNCLGKIQVFRD